MDFQNFLKGLDPKSLSEAAGKIKEFTKTEKGKEMVEKLKRGEKVGGVSKEDVLNVLKQNPELLQKLNDNK